MTKIYLFCKKLVSEIIQDEILSLAGEMSYKTLISLFPFMIFFTSLLTLLNLDWNVLLTFATPMISKQIIDFILLITEGASSTKQGFILYLSLIVAIGSASSGFKTVMRGINKSYGLKDERNFVITFLISVFIMFVFAGAIVLSLVVLIYGDLIKTFLSNSFPKISQTALMNGTYDFLIVFTVLLVVAFAVMAIYKISLCKNVPLKKLYKGSIFSVVSWVLACFVFNIYVNNFSSYGKLYTTISNIFVVALWINMTSCILLIGSEINSILEGRIE